MLQTAEEYFDDMMKNKTRPSDLVCRIIVELARMIPGKCSFTKMTDKELASALNAGENTWTELVLIAQKQKKAIDLGLFVEILQNTLPEIWQRWKKTKGLMT